MTAKLLVTASKIIEDIKYMNLASVCEDGSPWNTPVYCAYDEDLTFYWASWRLNQHSKNIRRNSKVFVTIYNSKVKEGEGFGVYMKGNAYQIDNPLKVLVGIRGLFSLLTKKLLE